MKIITLVMFFYIYKILVVYVCVAFSVGHSLYTRFTYGQTFFFVVVVVSKLGHSPLFIHTKQTIFNKYIRRKWILSAKK